jgi:hypothetical protein
MLDYDAAKFIADCFLDFYFEFNRFHEIQLKVIVADYEFLY